MKKSLAIILLGSYILLTYLYCFIDSNIYEIKINKKVSVKTLK